VQHTVESDASGFLHDVFAGMYADGSVLYKTYYPGPLNIGTDANRWQYDGAGRLKSIPGMITSQTYEADGQTKKIVYANGVSTQFSYSATRRWLERIVTKDAAGAELMNNFYSRDSRIGRIYAVAGLDVNNNWSCTYDDLDRLTFACNPGDATMSEAFSYDLADNMLSRTRMSGAYTYPAPGPRARTRLCRSGPAPSPMMPTAT
jgi:hypothetical protein